MKAYYYTVRFISPIEIPEEMIQKQLEDYLINSLYDNFYCRQDLYDALEDSDEGKGGIVFQSAKVSLVDEEVDL